MPKKNFKGSQALSYINQPEEETNREAAQPIPPAPVQKRGQKQKGEYWRTSFNLRPEYETFLKDEAWKARKDVTTYVNDLIAADMEAKQGALKK